MSDQVPLASVYALTEIPVFGVKAQVTNKSLYSYYYYYNYYDSSNKLNPKIENLSWYKILYGSHIIFYTYSSYRNDHQNVMENILRL